MIPFLEILCNSIADLNNGTRVVVPDVTAFAGAVKGGHICVSPRE